ncbi:hypothetical protein ACIRBX_38020 [Kitasatospora sp. NPDC096147]|uniref:hypothetical protein n=1 Tax=Kitasatospora sp. NPDC096147 TaxID=3364093 RepID=UPI00382FA622
MRGTGTVEEPRLTVLRHRPGAGRRRRSVALLAGLLALLLTGTGVLAAHGQLLLPFGTVTVLKGRMGSKSEFFEDDEVRRILLRHRIRLEITNAGSRELATEDVSPYDFVVTSGQPTGQMITEGRGDRGEHSYVKHPFVSPLVLATYRSYARALERAQVATPQQDGGSPTLYYHLDLAGLLRRISERETWNDLDVRAYGPANGNAVAVHTSDVCHSNSAGTFLAQVAFTLNGNARPETVADADRLAAVAGPLLAAQGMPGVDVFRPYSTEEGRAIAPVVAVYEHQYLAYQLKYKAVTGHPDGERVLLYPSNQFMTRPQVISLRDRADPLVDLVAGDPGLRARAIALGLRPPTGPGDRGLNGYLADQGLPVPAPAPDDTRTTMPELPVLERLISAAGGCPPVPPPAP